jgi:hypothetical protein
VAWSVDDVAGITGNVIMKTTLAILALGSLALMTSGDSLSEGHQSSPNYDREGYQNRSCCNWKSPHGPITN